MMMRHRSFLCGLTFALVCASAAGCGGDDEPTAIAIDEADGSLTVIASTFNRTCDEARSILLECGRWELLVNVAASAQTPGPKPLVSPATYAENLVSDGEPGGLECLVQGGTFEKGTIDITGSDEASVSFTIAGTLDGTFDADGSYEAIRCK